MTSFAAATTTYKNKELETTEWEDVLIKHGVIQEREEIKARREAREEAAKRTEKEVDPDEELLTKTLEELDVLEDDIEEDVLEKIRRQRLEELKAEAARHRFGDVLPLSRQDFIREVTDASRECWVVLEMFKDGIEESAKCTQLLRELAPRQPSVKFMRILSTNCIERWPDASVPTLFLYHGGRMVKQLTGLDFCGGILLSTVDTMEHALASLGVFEYVTDANLAAGARERRDEAAEVARERAEDNDAETRAHVEAVAQAASLGRKVSKVPDATRRGAAKLANLDDDDDDDW
ncbi:Phosducin-like protein [Hondaea fermentalgiana]|uniref:Phosducin-like protein n=1 Tax=Hondaea fermentalgiana TaxID=2315210 RepID=A0A2R5GNE2_9STRA|nr:Phosducin-like protein [Hondaea fermentalgiana]|eukprot:GBG29384.1 Phosducin-like protein [Hondaea fermentalgiana]